MIKTFRNRRHRQSRKSHSSTRRMRGGVSGGIGAVTSTLSAPFTGARNWLVGQYESFQKNREESPRLEGYRSEVPILIERLQKHKNTMTRTSNFASARADVDRLKEILEKLDKHGSLRNKNMVRTTRNNISVKGLNQIYTSSHPKYENAA